MRGDFLRESLRHALERRLRCSVHGAAAGGLVLVRAAARADGRAGGDVDDGSFVALDHVWEHELREDEGCVDVDGEAALPTARRVVDDWDVVVERGVVHEDVDGTVGGPCLIDQLHAVVFFGDVRLDHGGLAAGVLDVLDGAVEGAFEHPVVALGHGAGGTHDFRALGSEEFGDRLADAPAGAGYHRDLAV